MALPNWRDVPSYPPAGTVPAGWENTTGLSDIVKTVPWFWKASDPGQQNLAATGLSVGLPGGEQRGQWDKDPFHPPAGMFLTEQQPQASIMNPLEQTWRPIPGSPEDIMMRISRGEYRGGPPGMGPQMNPTQIPIARQRGGPQAPGLPPGLQGMIGGVSPPTVGQPNQPVSIEDLIAGAPPQATGMQPPTRPDLPLPPPVSQIAQIEQGGQAPVVNPTEQSMMPIPGAREDILARIAGGGYRGDASRPGMPMDPSQSQVPQRDTGNYPPEPQGRWLPGGMLTDPPTAMIGEGHRNYDWARNKGLVPGADTDAMRRDNSEFPLQQGRVSPDSLAGGRSPGEATMDGHAFENLPPVTAPTQGEAAHNRRPTQGMATLRGDQIAPPAIPSPLTPTDEDKQRLLATIQAKREFQADQKRKAIEARQERVAAAKDKQKRAAIRAIMNEKQGGGGKKKYTGQPSAQERARYQAYSPEKKERYMEWLVSTGGLPEEVAKKRIKNLEGTGGAGGGEDRANAAAGRTLSQAQGEFDGSEAGIRNRAARSLAQDNADQFRRSPEVMADREALGLSTDRDRDNLNMPNLAPGVRPRHITSRGAQGIAQPNLRMPNRAKPEEGMAGPTGIEGRVLSGLAGKKYPNRAKAIKDMKYKAQHARDNIGDDAAIRAAAGSGAPVRRPTDLDIDDQPTSVHPRKLVTKDKDTGKLSLNEGLNKGDAKRANAWISSRGKAKDVRAKRKEDALTKWYQRELGIGKTAAREYATGADTAGMTKPERAQHRRDKAKAASDASDAAARATTAGASASAARTRAAQLKADQREADIGRMDVRLRVQPELATADTAAGRLFRKQYNDLVPGTYAADDDPGATAKPGTTTVQPSHRLPDDIEAEYDAKKKALAAKYPERAGGGRHRIPNGKYNRELQDIEKQYKQDLAAAKRQVKRDAK